MQPGIDKGMRIMYYIIKNPVLYDKEVPRRTGNDLETVRKIRESLMELV